MIKKGFRIATRYQPCCFWNSAGEYNIWFCFFISYPICLLYPNENLLENAVARKKYITNISVALNTLCKEGKVVRYEVEGMKGDLYGLSQWMNEGKPNDDFIPDNVKITYNLI